MICLVVSLCVLIFSINNRFSPSSLSFFLFVVIGLSQEWDLTVIIGEFSRSLIQIFWLNVHFLEKNLIWQSVGDRYCLLESWPVKKGISECVIRTELTCFASSHFTSLRAWATFNCSKARCFATSVPLEIDWSLVRGSEGITFFLKFHWSIEIFSFSFWSI
jgi:hypothetical protein